MQTLPKPKVFPPPFSSLWFDLNDCGLLTYKVPPSTTIIPIFPPNPTSICVGTPYLTDPISGVTILTFTNSDTSGPIRNTGFNLLPFATQCNYRLKWKVLSPMTLDQIKNFRIAFYTGSIFQFNEVNYLYLICDYGASGMYLTTSGDILIPGSVSLYVAINYQLEIELTVETDNTPFFAPSSYPYFKYIGECRSRIYSIIPNDYLYLLKFPGCNFVKEYNYIDRFIEKSKLSIKLIYPLSINPLLALSRIDYERNLGNSYGLSGFGRSVSSCSILGCGNVPSNSCLDKTYWYFGVYQGFRVDPPRNVAIDFDIDNDYPGQFVAAVTIQQMSSASLWFYHSTNASGKNAIMTFKNAGNYLGTIPLYGVVDSFNVSVYYVGEGTSVDISERTLFQRISVITL